MTTATPSRSSDRRILRQMLSIPTAPFAEHLVVDYVHGFCSECRNVKLTRDAVGNVLVRVRHGRHVVSRPVCITAHLDHPGFVADRMTATGRLRAMWRGGVPKEYFVGSRVRFYVDDSWIRGRVRSIKTVLNRGQRRVQTAIVEVPGAVPCGSIGMWDLPENRIRGTRIHAGACDDLAGAAAMLCCIDRLARAKYPCDAFFLFTRAEEVGFVGATAAARLKTILKKCFVVAMETSSELSHAQMGDGPILRVGDRTSVFTPEVTAHCHRVAVDLAKRDRRFKFQRKLMDGGTCESSAYCALGYEATGLCLALGNYHNVDTKRKRLGLEYVDLNDFDNVVKWFVALSRVSQPYLGRDDALISLLKKLERKNKALLHASRDAPR